MIDKLNEKLNEMDEFYFLCIYNEYCAEKNMFEKQIYTMNEFNEFTYDDEIFDVVKMCCNDEFNPQHKYFKFDRCNKKFTSTNNLNDFICIDNKEIAKYMFENKNCLFNRDIENLMKKYLTK